MYKKPSLIMATLLILSGLYNNCTEVTKARQNDSIEAMIYFRSPVAINSVVPELQIHHLELRVFHREYKMGDQTFFDGYIVNPNNVDYLTESDLLNNLYWKSYAGMLQDNMQTSGSMLLNAKLDYESTRALQIYIKNIEKASLDFEEYADCWNTGFCPQVDVVSVLVEGAEVEVMAMSDVEYVSSIDVHYRLLASPQTQLSSNVAAVPANQWMPTRGVVDIYPSDLYPGERYIDNRMYWASAASLSGFDANSAYEHDLFLNNSSGSQYGPGTYLTDAQSLNGIPTIFYWNSNLPSPYLDTRFGDPDYLKSFTIGCAEADSIVHNTWYSYYIRAANGTATTDNGFLQAQLGHRTPTNCYTTWCVFGDQHRDIYAPYTIDPIPGTFEWQIYFVYLPIVTRNS